MKGTGILGLIYSQAQGKLHDTNRSDWWQLIALIPFIGIIVLIVFWARVTKEKEKKFDLN